MGGVAHSASAGRLTSLTQRVTSSSAAPARRSAAKGASEADENPRGLGQIGPRNRRTPPVLDAHETPWRKPPAETAPWGLRTRVRGDSKALTIPSSLPG